MIDLDDGVWRTINHRKVFIKKGEDLSNALKDNEKIENTEIKKLQFNNRKNLIDSLKQQLNIDLEKAATEDQFAPRTGLNIDSRKLSINEFNSIKKFALDHKIMIQENGAYDYFIRYNR